MRQRSMDSTANIYCPFLVLLLFLRVTFASNTTYISDPDTTFSNIDSITILCIENDTLLSEELGCGVTSMDSLEIAFFLDSTGYFSAIWRREEKSLIVETRERLSIQTILHRENRKDSTETVNLPYSASLIDRYLQQKITDFANRGYPFATISPTLFGDTLLLAYQKGNFAPKTELIIHSKEPIKEWLITRPLLFKSGSPFSYEKIKKSQTKLLTLPYIKEAHFGSPYALLQDSTNTIYQPLTIYPNHTFFFDGALGWQSEPEDLLTGSVDITLINLIKYGESIEVAYLGEDKFQRAEVTIEVPYVASLPFSLALDGTIEIAKEEYGHTRTGFSILYDVWYLWRAGIGGRFYEISSNIKEDNREYKGAEVSLKRQIRAPERGVFWWNLSMVAGSGITQTPQESFTRGETSFLAEWQIPLQRLALYTGLQQELIITTSQKGLTAVEKIRVGGSRSIRGYSEKIYPFVGAVINRNEMRYYYSRRGMVYLLADIGGGVEDHFTYDDGKILMGYGAGIRLPQGRYHFSFEWARHFQEKVGPGRIHISFGNV